MCYEDIKLGRRRTFRVTSVGAGAGLTLQPNSARVLLRLVIQSINNAAAGQAVVALDPASTTHILNCNSGQTTDQITLEHHGLLVTAGFFVINTALCTVIEIIDPLVDQAPN